ncbi:MAG TPA: hypothetical protein DCQ08_02740 [Amoebophilaceae bacterium]|nr:hypothetical protein [Amoebophilaceae bacterium]
MSRIKEKILTLYTKRLIKTGRIVRTSVGFQQAQNMGILYSADNPQKHEAACHLASQLNKLGKQVAGLCYATAPMQPTNLAFPTITRRDLRFWGTITNPQAQAFINTPFDYLFQVDLVGCPVLDYLLAKSQAKCRVGYYDTVRTSLFEMMVTFDKQPDSNNIKDLTAQMVHYTQLLKAP